VSYIPAAKKRIDSHRNRQLILWGKLGPSPERLEKMGKGCLPVVKGTRRPYFHTREYPATENLANLEPGDGTQPEVFYLLDIWEKQVSGDCEITTLHIPSLKDVALSDCEVKHPKSVRHAEDNRDWTIFMGQCHQVVQEARMAA
jgi:hypothetical protein